MGGSDKMEDFAEYRPISSRSILAFFLSLASMGALASMVLWILPVVAIVFCLLTLRSTRRSEIVPVGRSMAVLGLAVAVLVACWAPTRHVSRLWALSSQGREFCEQWLHIVLVEKNLDRAHGLTMAYGDRMLELRGSPGPGGATKKKKKKKKTPNPSGGVGYSVEKLFSKHPLRPLKDYADNGTIEYVGTEKVTLRKRWNGQKIKLKYKFSYTAKGEPVVVNLAIVVQREVFAELRRARWHIQDVLDADTKRSAMR